jgi:hypothetical protein
VVAHLRLHVRIKKMHYKSTNRTLFLMYKNNAMESIRRDPIKHHVTMWHETQEKVYTETKGNLQAVNR